MDGSEFKPTPEPETVSVPDSKFMKSLEDALGAERLNANKTGTGIASQFSNLSLTPSPFGGPAISSELSGLSLYGQTPLESPGPGLSPKAQRLRSGLTPKEPRLSIGLTPKEHRGSLGLTPKEQRLSTRLSFTGIESELSNISDSRILRTLSNLSACSTSSGCRRIHFGVVVHSLVFD